MGLRPLTARSVVLSVLLGAHPPELPARDLVRIGALFDISEPTLRVALTRMVAAGDLLRADATYRLSERLAGRQRRQDAALTPDTLDWQGSWEIAAVTATGRSPADRAELRTELTRLRLAELREGLWLRPANLRRTRPAERDGVLTWFHGEPDEDPVRLARTLWQLEAWATRATELHTHFAATRDQAERFTLAAALVRHLAADPILPEALLPDPWPAAELRAAYRGYQAELIELRERAGGA
ncbi:PaaX domain-containing protein, C- domain protein [Streptomyces sp. NA04227]|nr:PaaX domain-containing protein, C- domain protein [Streptomyces sp. NA04227]